MKNRLYVVFALVLAAVGWSWEVVAANPFQRLMPFKRIEADPSKSYELTDANGPWMVLATVFRGDNAEKEARELVYELRKKYKLEAYTHAKVFDYSHEVRGRGFNPDGTPKVMRHNQDEAIKEVAVMVGNFASIDDDNALETLKKIKTLEPATLRKADQSSQVFAELRNAVNAKKKKGPMGNAFVVTNPLLPPEYFRAAGIDKLVLDMNKDVQYSLFDCPGKYTVKVATFTGRGMLDQKKIRETMQGRGKTVSTALQEAAENAFLLCQELRKQGLEAYEFHDRDQSIVTVGSFDSLTAPGPNRERLPNPQIERLVKTFGASEITAAEMKRRQEQFPSFWKMLDMRPVAIEVPKRPVSSAYLR